MSYLVLICYGYDSWSLTVKAKRRLRAFENRILKRIFLANTEVAGEWKTVYIRGLHNVNSSTTIYFKNAQIKAREMAGRLMQKVEFRNA
jgi:hypothetical protein